MEALVAWVAAHPFAASYLLCICAFALAWSRGRRIVLQGRFVRGNYKLSRAQERRLAFWEGLTCWAFWLIGCTVATQALFGLYGWVRGWFG